MNASTGSVTAIGVPGTRGGPRPSRSGGLSGGRRGSRRRRGGRWPPRSRRSPDRPQGDPLVLVVGAFLQEAPGGVAVLAVRDRSRPGLPLVPGVAVVPVLKPAVLQAFL